MNPQIPQQSQSPEYTIRTHRPGDIGWIIHRHAALYENEQGWGTKMEALVCKVGAEFLDNYDVSIDRCWIAERNDEFLGCAVLVRDRELIDTAKLRLLLVEPSARGLGLGRALIEQCTRFARETGEKTNWRGPMVLMSTCWSVATYSCMNIVPSLHGRWAKFVLVSLTNVGGTTVHVLNVGWLVYHTKSKTTRGGNSALGLPFINPPVFLEWTSINCQGLYAYADFESRLMVMAANLGGRSGAQVLRQEDAPLYKHGFRNISCITAGCWIVAALLAVVYFYDERREREKSERGTVKEYDMGTAL
ncbi:hypothetical protein PDIDSM_5198 [Penicillium digitatum]|nr:hypothetical protein PDIDSM_5198 [Penicillium digitatum]